jgi:hypothetical protein
MSISNVEPLKKPNLTHNSKDRIVSLQGLNGKKVIQNPIIHKSRECGLMIGFLVTLGLLIATTLVTQGVIHIPVRVVAIPTGIIGGIWLFASLVHANSASLHKKTQNTHAVTESIRELSQIKIANENANKLTEIEEEKPSIQVNRNLRICVPVITQPVNLPSLQERLSQHEADNSNASLYTSAQDVAEKIYALFQVEEDKK